MVIVDVIKVKQDFNKSINVDGSVTHLQIFSVSLCDLKKVTRIPIRRDLHWSQTKTSETQVVGMQIRYNTNVMYTSYVFHLANPTQSSDNRESRDIRSRSHTLSYFHKVKRLLFNGQRRKACCIYEIRQKKCCSAGWSFCAFLFQERL